MTSERAKNKFLEWSVIGRIFTANWRQNEQTFANVNLHSSWCLDNERKKERKAKQSIPTEMLNLSVFVARNLKLLGDAEFLLLL
ncbi:hypothetical protein H5410_060759 [Solanum commersonii]|uniref:Uncharacterized protein n=1 Tax=Solanum commersonii TaxID=4109 RepID=A0A9J5W6C0_SOLCO|nr:hypothetical protein H5410_060759 [Solanum commersonii]